MLLDLFVSKKNNTKAENRLLKFVVVVIGCAVLFNTLMTLVALRTQRTVIVPPGFTKTMTLSGNDVDDEYMREFMRYVANLSFNYSPATARPQFDALLALYSPSTFPAARKMYYELADSIESGKVSNIFYPHEIKIDRGKSRVFMTGLLRRYASDIKMEDAVKAYVVEFAVADGRVLVNQILEKQDALEGPEKRK